MRNELRSEDIPAQVVELCTTLSRHGFRGWVVGGCVRDLLRKQPAADWDLATDATPEQVQKVFPRVIPTGIQHGTVTVRHRGASYEVTTLRGEGAYSDGRRPDRVEYVTDIREDLSRRDFTINAIAFDPVANKLEDPFDGLGDLSRATIRAVGDPRTRFSEDGLRVLRAARFCASLEFQLEPATEAAIAPTLETFRRVSAERVREEWLKALKAREPSRAFAVMRRTGILGVTAPALLALSDETWARVMRAVDSAPPVLELRLAALLWPLRERPDELAEWLTRYRFSNQERERVLRLLRFGAPADSGAWADVEVRRYARDVGRPFVEELGSFGELVAAAYEGEAAALAARRLRTRLAALVTEKTPLAARELALGGRELMEGLGVPPGPRVGKLLEHLLEAALHDPDINTRERLLSEARARLAEE